MPAPLVGLAVGALARAAAKKVASNAVKKAAATAAAKKTAKIASNSVKPIKAGPAYANKFNQGSMMKTTDAATGAAAKKGAAKVGVTGTKGAQPPIKINTATKSAAKTKADAKALKAANNKTNKTGSAMNKLERKSFQGKNEMIKSMQNTERAGLSKTSRKTTKGK
jgi:hypothetical protein